MTRRCDKYGVKCQNTIFLKRKNGNIRLLPRSDNFGKNYFMAKKSKIVENEIFVRNLDLGIFFAILRIRL